MDKGSPISDLPGESTNMQESPLQHRQPDRPPSEGSNMAMTSPTETASSPDGLLDASVAVSVAVDDQPTLDCPSQASQEDAETTTVDTDVSLDHSPKAGLIVDGSAPCSPTTVSREDEIQPPVMERQASKQSGRSSSSSRASTYSGGVDWDELGRSEEQEARQDSSDESTALLLARLEQANDALATDPKSGIPIAQSKRTAQLRRQSRPPSIHQLKSLLTAPTPPSLRYSLLPAPPPMTDLEFYAALVADYPRTAQCLPTLLSKKVRSGIPPPLRGVVWVSMTGARDQLLEEQYERLSGEPSPYENMIGKDIGRSFPGVEMFREPGGEGQRKLGHVLKCFSLYDQKIGYCQGLGFLVGPLLMHMEEKEAFIILVRLMEHYDLRSCFLPDLSGLHLRIYQFRHLLAQHLPSLAAHLESLQVNPAYVSQWFLSFFAVTCPLPMLLRIYDVIFAEGASETLMRVALSLMRRNEKKLLACSELEEAMQLLLSRGVWDVYNYNADDFVNDFVDLTSAVARDGLLALEASFKEAKQDGAHAKLGSLPDLQAAASRFLGRFWAGSGSSTKSASLSPDAAASSRPSSFLYRSPSKNSLASTLNSFEAASDSGVSGVSSMSTEATSMSRQPSMESAPTKLNVAIPGSANQSHQQSRALEKDLQGQIEDLVTALSEMQKSQALLGNELQRERDAREKDGEVVRNLIASWKRTGPVELVKQDEEASEPKSEDQEPTEQHAEAEEHTGDGTESTVEDFQHLLDEVEERFAASCDAQRQVSSSTEADTRLELDLLKVQYEQELLKSQQLSLRLNEQNAEIAGLGEKLKDARLRVQEGHKEKERLHSALQELRARRPSETPSGTGSSVPKPNFDNSNRRSSTYSGLREFRLNKSATMNSQQAPTFSRRTSSLNTQAMAAAQTAQHQRTSAQTTQTQATQTEEPPQQSSGTEEALLLELVNAKTAEASAKQEADELRSKLDSLRRLIGASEAPAVTAAGPDASSTSAHSSVDMSTPRNLFNSLISSGASKKTESSHGVAAAGTGSTSTTTNNHSSSGGGFWGGWGKRSASNNSVTESQ